MASMAAMSNPARALGFTGRRRGMDTLEDFERHLAADTEALEQYEKDIIKLDDTLELFPDDEDTLEQKGLRLRAIEKLKIAIPIWKKSIADFKADEAAEAPEASEAVEEMTSPPTDAPTPTEAQPKPPAATETDRVFKVNEKVMARGDDRKLQPAVVLGVQNAGNAERRKYIVMFLNDKLNRRKELPQKDVRVNFLEERKKAERKKKQEEEAAAQAARAAGIFAGPASINANVQKREPSKVSDGPPKSETMQPRRLKNSREYNAHRNNWKEFQKKGKVMKRTKKESMFRTVEGDPNAKVGVIGSGRGMTKDQPRIKHSTKPIPGLKIRTDDDYDN